MTPEHYNHIFELAIDRLKTEGRYREFADICRVRGTFPGPFTRQAQRVKSAGVQ